jgi:hypothetical protein
MRAATSEQLIRAHALGAATGWRPRVKLRFDQPDEVVDDPALEREEKRAVLSSWASDACAVRDEPGLRWLLGTSGPVRLDDIRKALSKLDEQEARR